MVGTTYVEVACHTDIGRLRDHNEDAVLACVVDGCGRIADLNAVVAVADGVGGNAGGELASAAAIQEIKARLVSRHSDSSLETRLEAVDEVLRLANGSVVNLGAEIGRGAPATTATVCALGAESFTVGHIGDTRAYLVSEGVASQLTQDDTYVAEAVLRGVLTEVDARESEQRHQLTRCLGIGLQVQTQVFDHGWSAGDVVVVCSDGLSEYVTPQDIVAVCSASSTLSDFCSVLVAVANERGGSDNISVAAARNGTVRAVAPTAGFPMSAAGMQRHRLGSSKEAANSPKTSSSVGLRVALATVIALLLLVSGLYVSRRGGNEAKRVPPAASVAGPTATVQLTEDGRMILVQVAGARLSADSKDHGVHGLSDGFLLDIRDPGRLRRQLASQGAAIAIVDGRGGVVTKGSLDRPMATAELQMDSDYRIEVHSRRQAPIVLASFKLLKEDSANER
jgi:serine/threonine protein phosphatase PrpC